MRSRFLAICVVQLSLFSFAEARRPNVIVIFTDDHGWTDLGIQDIRDDLKTPHIDAMAAEGLRMTNGYVTAPQCVPSRAGLLTESHKIDLALRATANHSKVSITNPQLLSDCKKPATPLA